VGTEEFLFFINVISLSSIKFCLFIYGVFFYFGGIVEFIYFKKYQIFNVNYFYVNELLCSFIIFFNYIKISFQ